MSLLDRKLEIDPYEDGLVPKFAHIQMSASTSETSLDMSVIIGILASGQSKIEDAKEILAAQQMDLFKVIQAQRELFSSHELQDKKVRLRASIVDLQNLLTLFTNCATLLSSIQLSQLKQGGDHSPSLEKLFSDLELKISRFQLSISAYSQYHGATVDIISTLTEHIITTVEHGVQELKVITSEVFNTIDTVIAGGTPRSSYLLFMVNGIRAVLDRALDDI